MADLTRILFVSGEVVPFSKVSPIGQMVRKLPELLQDSGDYETRIMMPRYGTISERRNRLHEVIRLSGTEIAIGANTQTLKVKVASIPGIRLQVYFMDNAHFFKRKGVSADRQGKVFEDNVERALFFSRAVIETTRNLGWKPEIVHAHGWISGFMPLLLRTVYAGDPLFGDVKVIYTPDADDISQQIDADRLADLDLPQDADLTDVNLNSVGFHYADSVVTIGENHEGDRSMHFESDEELLQQGKEIYEQVLTEGRVLA